MIWIIWDKVVDAEIKQSERFSGGSKCKTKLQYVQEITLPNVKTLEDFGLFCYAFQC